MRPDLLFRILVIVPTLTTMLDHITSSDCVEKEGLVNFDTKAMRYPIEDDASNVTAPKSHACSGQGCSKRIKDIVNASWVLRAGQVSRFPFFRDPERGLCKGEVNEPHFDISVT